MQVSKDGPPWLQVSKDGSPRLQVSVASKLAPHGTRWYRGSNAGFTTPFNHTCAGSNHNTLNTLLICGSLLTTGMQHSRLFVGFFVSGMYQILIFRFFWNFAVSRRKETTQEWHIASPQHFLPFQKGHCQLYGTWTVGQGYCSNTIFLEVDLFHLVIFATLSKHHTEPMSDQGASFNKTKTKY